MQIAAGARQVAANAGEMPILSRSIIVLARRSLHLSWTAAQSVCAGATPVLSRFSNKDSDAFPRIRTLPCLDVARFGTMSSTSRHP